MRAFVRSTALVCTSFVALPGTAKAECPNAVGANANLDRIDAPTRARFVRKSLDDDASNARLWTWSWAGIGAAAAAVNGVWAAASDYDQRVDRIGAATSSVLLAVATLIDPMSVTSDAAAVGTAVDASAAGRAGDDPCAVVRYAEQYLARSAEDESKRRGFVRHALPIGVAIAGGLVLGVGYGHWQAGALNAGLGVLVTEVKIFTQPTGSARALERYRSGVLRNDGPAVGWQLRPVVSQQGGGLSLTLVY